MTKRKTKTAAELMAELNANPKFAAQEREREEKRLVKEAELRRAENPLIEDLNRIGVRASSAWDLVNAAGYDRKAVVSILVEHLEREYPERVREGIARALAVPEAIAEWEKLLRLFDVEKDPTTTGVKWAIACALAAAATDDVIEDVIHLLEDRKHGGNRIALVGALARANDPRAREALRALSADAELAKEVKRALKASERKKEVPARVVGEEKGFGDLSEVSMNFDSSLVRPFLERVAGRVRGFETAHVAEVIKVVDSLEIDDERELNFEVVHQGYQVPLHIGIFLDDTDAVDVYLWTVPKLAQELEGLMKDFAEEHRI